MGDDVTAVDKLEFHVKAIAGGHLLVIVKAGAGNSFKKALKIPKGYKKVKGMRSHGQPIFKKGNRYITPDVDGHNGGSWKMADSVDNLKRKSTRMGTYDENLNKIGD
ncbi:MAG: toxin C-terminal domain-containing protein [Carboxylicivirga sp.]|nr:toxin C-terminal domain-containing protein [Carboxylicivirga sp.]